MFELGSGRVNRLVAHTLILLFLLSLLPPPLSPPPFSPLLLLQIYQRYTKHFPPEMSEVALYHENTVHKVGGLWYSTEVEGQCDREGSKPCTWRVVQVAKKVSKKCSDAAIDAAVMTSSGAGGPNCFSKCPQPHNSSTICWIRCFYQTVLGQSSGTQRINYTGANSSLPSNTGTGMAMSALKAAWEQPFASTDPSKGGCPDLL